MLPLSAHAFFIGLHDSPCMSQGHEESPRGLWGQLLLFMCKIWLGNCNLNLGHWNWIGITSQTATTSAQVYRHVFFWFSFFFSWCLETRFYIVRLVSHWPWNWGWHKPWSSCPHHLRPHWHAPATHWAYFIGVFWWTDTIDFFFVVVLQMKYLVRNSFI